MLRVIRIEDHRPVDGPVEPKAVAILSDGSWEFVWNLKEPQLKAAMSLIRTG